MQFLCERPAGIVTPVGPGEIFRGIGLYWLPAPSDWADALAALDGQTGAEAWRTITALANMRLSLIQTLHLDRRIRRLFADEPPPGLTTMPVRLAILSSSTVDHLLPGIRVGGARHGLWVQTYTPDYGQYANELRDENSALHAFKPSTALFAVDAHTHLAGFTPAMDTATAERQLEELRTTITAQWRQIRERHQAQVIQQTILPVFAPLVGNNEHRLAGSPAWLCQRLNMQLRDMADAEGVDLVALDMRAAHDGLSAWHDPALWHRAKQEVHPSAAPMYGELVGRVLAASQGRTSKCLVLDLDNTLWGGVIGDDGMAGIQLGQGSAAGEAFIAFQQYARDLSQRGVILAVCSKNDEANALEPFEKHPEMILKRRDIACFMANWNDKVSNLRAIAEQLNIGLDSLVFADDNPFERTLVRRDLPMVAVPELPADPTQYAACIADAGYFETLRVVEEDRHRSGQYQANLERKSLAATATDMGSYLRSLDMQMQWSRFDRIGQARIVQLINKTNQFNLTTRRTNSETIAELIGDPRALTLQIRLLDKFGDNGIIAIVIGRFEDDPQSLEIDTWLMSCRVLGRQVEQATLNLVVAEAQRLGAARILGTYRPSEKNGMVKDHYPNLGFLPLHRGDDGSTHWVLDLTAFTPSETMMRIVDVTEAPVPAVPA